MSVPSLTRHLAQELDPARTSEIDSLIRALKDLEDPMIGELLAEHAPSLATSTPPAHVAEIELAFDISDASQPVGDDANSQTPTASRQQAVDAEVIADAAQLDTPDDDHAATQEDGGFIDRYFGPTATTLAPDGNLDKKPRWKEFGWMRAPAIRDSQGLPLALFRHGDVSGEAAISPNDVKQGELGDCYFLAALSTLAERPRLIHELFVTDSISPRGRYVIRLFKQSLPKTIAVDDFFPCHMHAMQKVDEFGHPKPGEMVAAGSPCFSDSASGELWVMLLEKAWAKLHGSYERIEAGSTGNALSDLTGAPHFDIRWRQGEESLGFGRLDVDSAWAALRTAEAQQFPLAASMPSIVTHDMQRDFGLVEKHAYAILETRELDGGELRLVKCVRPTHSRALARPTRARPLAH